MKDYGREILRLQRLAIIDMCKEAYPNSVEVSYIGLKTHCLVNKNIVEKLIEEGIIERVGSSQLRLNG